MFHDINEILIIFHQKINKSIRIGSEQKETWNCTKKIFINSNPKKKTKKRT